MCVVYRATTVVNFGHGDLVMAGAFVVYLLVVMAGLPFLASAVLAVALLFLLGLVIELGLVQRLKAGPPIRLPPVGHALGHVPPRHARAPWGARGLPMP